MSFHSTMWIIIGIAVMVILIIIYAIWYRIKSKKDPYFKYDDIKFLMVRMAKYKRRNKNWIFILDFQINSYFIRGFKDNVDGIVLLSNVMFIFKYVPAFLSTNPGEQENEDKVVKRICKKFDMTTDQVCYVRMVDQQLLVKNYKYKINTLHNVCNRMAELNEAAMIGRAKQLNHAKIVNDIKKGV